MIEIEVSNDTAWAETDRLIGKAMRQIFNLSKQPWDKRTQQAFAAIKSRAVVEAIARGLHESYVCELLDMLVPR